jgi:tRNA-specific 2-thiouridylase
VSKKGKVLLAMSGGIDSSISALLLHEQGYEIIGYTIKTWDFSLYSDDKEPDNNDAGFIKDAKQIANKIGFSHYVLDVREEFNKLITDNFVSEYLSGRTPNPCVICNPAIKWRLLLAEADKHGCEYFATGHYARIRNEHNRYILYKGADENKDQSYVLWRLIQDSLKRTIFPLGDMKKQDIKKIAMNEGFENLTEKKESFEICFIPDDNYRSYLKLKVPGLSEKYNGGDFISTDGKFIGKHKGFPFYTIGQRKGLNVAVGVPLYVIDIRPESNTIVLGQKEELVKRNMKVGNYNLIKYPELPENIEVVTKIRYKDQGTLSNLSLKDDIIDVTFKGKVNAVAPGQSAVFYEKDDVVGGGFILK